MLRLKPDMSNSALYMPVVLVGKSDSLACAVIMYSVDRTSREQSNFETFILAVAVVVDRLNGWILNRWVLCVVMCLVCCCCGKTGEGKRQSLGLRNIKEGDSMGESA